MYILYSPTECLTVEQLNKQQLNFWPKGEWWASARRETLSSPRELSLVVYLYRSVNFYWKNICVDDWVLICSPTSRVLVLVTHSSFTGTRECRKCGVHSSDGCNLNRDAIHLWVPTWAVDQPKQYLFIKYIFVCII